MNGWIGVDLDGTLAEYNGWVGPLEIGAPVPAMVERVKAWMRGEHTSGVSDVRIFTARLFPGPYEAEHPGAVLHAIENWCLDVFGRTFPVTYQKDYGMVELWDDRAVQIEPNTGRRVDGLE